MGVDKVAGNGCRSRPAPGPMRRPLGRCGPPLALCIDSFQCMWLAGRYRIVAHVRLVFVELGGRR